MLSPEVGASCAGCGTNTLTGFATVMLSPVVGATCAGIGMKTLIGWITKMLSGDVSMSEGTVRHFLSTHVIRIDGERAFSTSHLQAVSTTTMETLANGFVEAEHVRAREGWRIRFYKVTEQITDKDMLAFKQTLGLEYK